MNHQIKISYENEFKEFVEVLHNYYDSTFYRFLNQQLFLYADACSGRNFNWYSELESLFPKDFLFKNIWNLDLNQHIRSALCSMAVSMYIDHEPFAKQEMPGLCRLYEDDHIHGIGLDNQEKEPGLHDMKSTIDREGRFYEDFLNHNLDYLKTQVENIISGGDYQFDEFL